ncbi:hypothetical protein QUB80_02400 [Chlorogloeopsis sp. ULAP01]|uniref:hypothetical protein n=1 Tax=Chlorogloeopsis sp. ULAP01 TaxID=3056483 RepID=UPI0025AA89C6|nr:hypothetical protein [Chlorogloeopsis sp. ULAP01]MDM9379552.1 hypothetical protein [Chlorogloeopsis sp. ULAP01]
MPKVREVYQYQIPLHPHTSVAWKLAACAFLMIYDRLRANLKLGMLLLFALELSHSEIFELDGVYPIRH